MQALTTEIMKLEKQVGLNPVQMIAVAEMRAAFDSIIIGYINNGVIAGTAKTTLQEILDDLIAAAVLLGAPPPGPAIPPTADSDGRGGSRSRYRIANGGLTGRKLTGPGQGPFFSGS